MRNKIPGRILKEINRYPLFYRKVWIACHAIPAGQTRSYGEIAKLIGHPRAARAVGNALARNPFAPLIPCHRVIRRDGKLGGYSGNGGVKTKVKLLERERL